MQDRGGQTAVTPPSPHWDKVRRQECGVVVILLHFRTHTGVSKPLLSVLSLAQDRSVSDVYCWHLGHAPFCLLLSIRFSLRLLSSTRPHPSPPFRALALAALLAGVAQPSLRSESLTIS